MGKYTKKGKYTKYVVNGYDILADMTVNEREVEYVDNYRETEDPDTNVPQKRLRVSYPFSSLGLRAGIRFNFFQ